MIYEHKKTGNLYKALNLEAIDCTNNRAEDTMVVYESFPSTGQIFVRDQKEFYARFEKINTVDRIRVSLKEVVNLMVRDRLTNVDSLKKYLESNGIVVDE